MASNSHRKSGSSARSTGRKRVVIGAEETVRVRYKKDRPEIESERRRTPHARERGDERANGGAGARVASSKRAERERRQHAIVRRRWLVGAVAAALVIGCVWGLAALARAPLFSVEQITVTGTSRLTRNQVLKRAQIPSGATLVRLPKGAIVKRLLADPWVKSVRVSRRFPHALEIVVTERKPAAIVDAGGTAIWLVDDSATWLAPRSAADTGTMPVVRDVENLAPKAGERAQSAELQNAIAVLNGLSRELRQKVRTVTAPTVDRTALILPHGVQIFVGSAEDIAKKDEVARAILAQNKNVVYVNVRVVNRPTWRGLDTGN